MGRRFVLWLLSYAWIALLVGLGLLGMAGYSVYSADHGGKIPKEADLTVTAGHILEGREVTVEHRRRRGGRSTSKHFELDLKPASGEIIKLKVDFAVSPEALENAIDEDVTVKYDPEDDNNTYVIESGGKDLLAYADMAQLSQKRADEDKALFTSAGMLTFAVVLALLGGAGVWGRRKMLASAHQEQMAVQAPGAASMGADLPDQQGPTAKS